MIEKLRDCFDEMVVYKDLRKSNFFAALGLPSFLRDWLLKKFKYAEVIIGADFLYKKDTSLANAVACYLEQGESVPRRIRKYENLVRMMQAGNLVIHSSPHIIDHRKMYFLKADDGKTRVIVGSGNASWKAWSSDQLENYVCYDTPEDYDKWVLAFKTAWELSEEIPYEVVGQKETDDPLKANAFIKKVQEQLMNTH